MADSDLKFKTGNICRVYIKDFLTFDEVEVRPKPRLNFICGPNGSGKSTILCAICICLGGRPAVTGRGKQVAEFVKMGKEVAVLEMEIYIEGQVNVVISREFDTKNKSVWFLQGKEVLKKMVDQKIQELNIQVDNLCQFLPQDRVAAFAKMNHRELLQATEKAVGDPSLFEQHDTLCSSGERLVALQDRVKELQDKLETAERRNARLKDVVDNLEVKVKLEADIKQLKTQRVWYLYDDKRKVHAQHREELSKYQGELKEKRGLMEPAMKRLRETNAVLQKLNVMMKEKAQHVRRHQQGHDALQAEYEQHADLVNDARRTFLIKQQEQEQQKNELLDYNRQLDVLLCQLQNLPEVNEAEVAGRLKELTGKIHKASQVIARLQGRTAEVVGAREAKRRRIRECQQELNSKQDVTKQRLDLLRQRFPDIYKATLWLQKNKSKFEAEVYSPICTLLNLHDPKYARYIENRVANRDLVSFVCESKEDVNLLKEAMDSQRLRVNIIHSTAAGLEKYQPPQPIQELRRYGFERYMLECLDAPPAVLTFLCKSYHLHSVPIAHHQGDYGAVPPSIPVFYMGDQRYSRLKSRYDGEVSTSINPLRDAQLLHITVDTQRISQLQQEVATLTARLEEDDQDLKGIKEEEEGLSRNLETWRNEKRALAFRKEERKLQEQRISQKRNQIARCEQGGVDLEAERAKMEATTKKSIKEMVGATLGLGGALEKSVEGVAESLKVAAKAKVVAKEVRILEDKSATQQSELETLERATKEMAQQLESYKSEAQAALFQLKDLLGITSIKQITPEIREQFQNSSLEETERLLGEKEAHHSCLTTATNKELEEYRRRQLELEQLRRKLEEGQRATDNHHHNLEEVKESWLPHITRLVSDISQTFSRFMSRMGCAGEVELQEAGDDFKSYGMVIKVKFRDHQRLKELNAQHQSGGERALSTALYLMSLQSLATAPFRCVDEINQGMDPINERQMLQMLMETEDSEDSSQYFFVTPKLLQDIEYTQNVAVMVVYNSPTALSHRKLSIKRALKRKKEADRRR